MSNSKKVKLWRKRTKERIMEAMGGKCQCCNYFGCPAAMELHHLDPNEKEFSFGKVRANPKNWEAICIELRKCVLLCANCHREIHANYRTLPSSFKSFDESYLEYKTAERIQNGHLTPCRVCGTMKIKNKKTCSDLCYSKIRGKINWEEVNLGFLLTSNKYNFCAVGRILQISDNAVRKRAKKIGLI